MAGSPLTRFPIALLGPLPPFRDDGALPPGDYAPSRKDFEERFVGVAHGGRRQAIYAGWNLHRAALMAGGLPAATRQLLDGSFTTGKASPDDIDLAVEVPIDRRALDDLDPETHPILSLLQGPRTKPTHACDAYPIYSLPVQDPDYDAVTARLISYWTKWFGTTRSGLPKGRVWATTGGLP